MPTKVALPEMGEGVMDATITQWLKKEGEHVEITLSIRNTSKKT